MSMNTFKPQKFFNANPIRKIIFLFISHTSSLLYLHTWWSGASICYPIIVSCDVTVNKELWTSPSGGRTRHSWCLYLFCCYCSAKLTKGTFQRVRESLASVTLLNNYLLLLACLSCLVSCLSLRWFTISSSPIFFFYFNRLFIVMPAQFDFTRGVFFFNLSCFCFYVKFITQTMPAVLARSKDIEGSFFIF